MKTRILLVNFNGKERDSLLKLDIDVDLGYLSDTYIVAAHDGSTIREANFYSPYAIYDYKAIFIKLTKSPPLENQLKEKAKSIGEKERVTFLRYWYDQKGVMGIFTEDGDFNSLDILGIPQVSLVDSRGNDKTVFHSLKSGDRPLRSTLEELTSLIVIPPKKYVDVRRNESRTSERNWVIFPAYENRNDEHMGAYLNWGYSHSDDAPAFLILPQYRDYPKVISKLVKAYAQVYPKVFTEIADQIWSKSDKCFPKEISLIDDEMKKLLEKTEHEMKVFRAKKNNLKQKYSYLRDLLTESGDKLKVAVITTLSDVFNLMAIDADEKRKTDLKEDVVIQDPSFPTILAEVKGTKNSYPSLTYVSQVYRNLLTERDKYPDAVGGLILNLDRLREPSDLSPAYTKPDEENQLNGIVYIDTRVLFDLSIAVIDHGLTIKKAKEILLKKGRITFDLKKYLKSKS